MPVYNAEDYLEISISSILNQTYKNFEFLIIDDGSTDNSLNIIKKYASVDERIRFVSRENKGLSKTLNELVEMSKGEFLARMDADDFSYPDRFEKQLNYMNNHPDIVVVGALIRRTDNGEVCFCQKYSDETRKARMLFYNAGVAHPTAFVRKDFLEIYNICYNEEKDIAEDYYFWTEIIKHGGKIDSLQEILLDYRVSSTQITSISKLEMEKRSLCARRNLLETLGEFSVEEKENFYNIRINPEKLNAIDVDQLFDKIKLENELSGYCDSSTINKELGFQWILLGLLILKRQKDFSYLKSKYMKKYLFNESFVDICNNIRGLLKKEYSKNGKGIGVR